MRRTPRSVPASLALACLLLAAAAAGVRAAPAAALGWLDAPSARSDLDTLLAPPGRPLGGRDPEQDPALSPDGRWLAYSAFSDGNWDIWLRDLQAGPGGRARRLTDHVAADLRPRFAADGAALLFVSQRQDPAGDLWEIPLRRWPGGLRPGRARVLLRRPGSQDHPCRDARGALYFDEESPGGSRVMRWRAPGQARELARPAALPRPGHGGLYLVSLADSQAVLEWLADSLLGKAGPGTQRRVVWRPPGALLDYEPGPGGRLWAVTLTEGRVRRAGDDLALPSQLWQVASDGVRPPRPLLEEGRAPRQLALAGRRLVYTEDERPSLLWLEDAEGRFPMGGAAAGGGAATAVASPATWLELSRRYADDALGLPLLQTIQANWPGSPEADAAALRELRRRMLRGESRANLQDRLRDLRGWMRGPEALARLEAMELEIQLRGERRSDLSPLEDLARRCLEQGLPGAAAEARLARARLELEAGRPDRALGALLDMEALPDSLPEQADGLALRVRAWEGLGQSEAARGALKALALEHADRPELLSDWLRQDLAGLAGLPDTRLRLRLRERLADLGGIPPLRLALLVELSSREAAAGADGRAVALEDLRLALRARPDSLGPFERRAWTQGQGLLAELRRSGSLDEALAGLAAADESLLAAGEPALAGILRVKRIDWLLERATTAGREGDWEPAEADTRQVLLLDPAETRAWRLRMEALARLGRLDAEEELLRARRKASAGHGSASRAQVLRGPALQRRAVETWALGLLLSWRAEEDLARLPESDQLLEEALALDDRLAPACLSLSWNLGRELRLAEGRRGGLKGLLQELGSGRQAVNRLRHRGLSRLEVDEESLRDRAILLAERGLRWADPARDADLATALATNLGNLYFSLGEFGALKARQAWQKRLEISPGFHSGEERLRFLMNLGTAQQWSGDLEHAAASLDSALALAARLNLPRERKELLARLSMLAGEREQPVEAQNRLRQVLALETDHGQRALLWRNLAIIQLDLGDAGPARQSLAQAALEAGQGAWPLEPEQNWLRLGLLGISIPVWNFPGLYTGQGRLDWGPEEEEALRQALRDQMSGRQGALDLRLQGMLARRRLLRQQGDTEGMLRLDLAMAREQASLGRWEAALRRFDAAAGIARTAVLAGPEARALEGALGSLLLGRRELAADTAAVARLEGLAGGLRRELETLLGAGAPLLPPEQRLRLELLRVQDLDDQASAADPVRALLLRSRALLALEDVESWRRAAELAWTPRQRLSLDLAWARLLTAVGDPEAALERLAGWDAAELPSEPALLFLWARLQAARLLGRHEEERELLTRALERLADLPADPDRLLAVRRAGLLEDELERLAAQDGPVAADRAADLRAWWRGRRLWEQADPAFPAEAWTNAWGNLRADLAQRERLLEARFESGDPAWADTLKAVDAALAATRAGLAARESRLRLWSQPGDAGASWPRLRGEGLCWVGRGDSLAGRWLTACPSVHAVLEEGDVLAPDWVSLVRAHPLPALPDLRQVSPADLEGQGSSGLDGRILCLDAVLRLVPGAPQAAWLDFEGARVPLRDLMGLDLPGELLVVGEVDWQAERPESWVEGWLALERLLAQAGLRRALMPGPGLRLRGEELARYGLSLLTDSLAAPPAGWWALGARPLDRATRLAGQRSGLEQLVLLGNEFRRREEPEGAWRAYRRALRLAVQLNDGPSAGRLARLAAASALEGGRPGEALDLLLEELAAVDPAQVEWDKVSGRLVQLADLAGRKAQADSLWRQLVLQGLPVGAPAGTQDAAAADSSTEAGKRAALDSRLLALERHGARERAAELARARDLLPEGEDPVRALFLARLYLDTESAPRARDCLQATGVRWERLDSLARLDLLELRSLTAARLGDLREAGAWMERSAALTDSLDLPPPRRALNLQRRADLAWSLGRYQDCAQWLDQAAGQLPAEADLAQEDELRLALLVANTRGLLATELEEDAEAATQFSRAQALGLRLRDPLELSAVFNNQSRLAQRAGRWTEALENCRLAQEQDSLSGSLRRSLATLRNRASSTRGLLGPDLHLPEAWLSLPEGLLRQRRASAELGRLARELEAGLGAARELGDEREACRLELELVWLRLEMDQPEAALAPARACAERAGRLLFRRERLEALLAAGRALVRLKKAKEAEELLLAALAESEEETARLAPVRFDPGRGWLQRRLTDELVDLYGTQQRPWEALAASERGRNLGLQEMASRREGATALPSLGERRNLESLLRGALEPGQALLGWHLGRARAWGFLWQEGRLESWLLPLPPDSLVHLTALHRERILAFLSPEQTGRRLAEVLLPPAWGDHPPARVWLLPQGPLHELAFESLLLPGGAWLGGRAALCRSGSLAELGFSARLPGGSGPAAIWSDPRAPGVEPLEYTGLEAEELSRLFPDCLLLSGDRAGEGELRADRPARRFRHFACHAQHDPRSPAESALLLSPALGDDGRLSAPEIAGLDLPAGLTMLSACETGLGRSGEEASAGLPRAFMVAGSRGVLASLWRVDDLATAVLVKHLYRALRRGLPADLALQEAQEAVRTWVDPHPAYWAAFCLTGQSRPEPASAGSR